MVECSAADSSFWLALAFGLYAVVAVWLTVVVAESSVDVVEELEVVAVPFVGVVVGPFAAADPFAAVDPFVVAVSKDFFVSSVELLFGTEPKPLRSDSHLPSVAWLVGVAASVANDG